MADTPPPQDRETQPAPSYPPPVYASLSASQARRRWQCLPGRPGTGRPRMMSNDADRDTHLAVGDFVIDRADERVIGPGGPLKLGNKAYRVLLSLAEQDGKLLTKDALFSSVWDGTTVSESALTSVIKELRRALGDESRTPRYIESVYGRGYRLLERVRPVGREG